MQQKKPFYKQLYQISEKLVLFSAIFALVTEISKEDNDMFLAEVLYMRKDINKVQTLLDLSSKVNIKTLIYDSKLGFRVSYTNIGNQKLDDSTLKTFKIVLASFEIKDKLV